MKTLVLNVDRDDDFGRKAKINSPIIGLKNNLNAGNELAMADPEDSDVNAIFAAISLYKQLSDQKKDVEIATICGDINVGFKSDEILSEQLEEVIDKTKVDNVILVTDGAEDEYILPIIQSRIKITSINRVSVKQSRELEDTYYRILKILNDEKVMKQFVLPIALVLIVWAFFVLLNMTSSGFGAILLTLGAYLLIRVFRWERKLEIFWEEAKTGFLAGKLALYTYVLAGVILVAFGLLAMQNLENSNISADPPMIPVLFFLYNMVWGIVIAGIIAIFGRAVDRYMKDKKLPNIYYSAPFSLFAFGFIFYAILGVLYKALRNWPKTFEAEHFGTANFIFYTATGILILLIGAVINHYMKEESGTEEKAVKKLVKEN